MTLYLRLKARQILPMVKYTILRFIITLKCWSHFQSNLQNGYFTLWLQITITYDRCFLLLESQISTLSESLSECSIHSFALYLFKIQFWMTMLYMFFQYHDGMWSTIWTIKNLIVLKKHRTYGIKWCTTHCLSWTKI